MSNLFLPIKFLKLFLVILFYSRFSWIFDPFELLSQISFLLFIFTSCYYPTKNKLPIQVDIVVMVFKGLNQLIDKSSKINPSTPSLSFKECRYSMGLMYLIRKTYLLFAAFLIFSIPIGSYVGVHNRRRTSSWAR